MKIAVSYWHNKISPVMDVAENFLIIDILNGKPIKNRKINLSGKSHAEKVEYFVKRNIDVLLCGAISNRYHCLIMAKGIEVIPWLTGDIDGILDAYLYSKSLESGFIMPGRKGRRRQRHQNKKGFKNKI